MSARPARRCCTHRDNGITNGPSDLVPTPPETTNSMDTKRLNETSKFLSYVLRHEPQAVAHRTVPMSCLA